MGIFDYLFKRKYVFHDSSCGIISTLPESDEDTYVRTAPEESVVVKNLGDSLEITIVDSYDRLITKSITKKSSILSYDLNKYVQKTSRIQNKYYQCYDVVIDSAPNGRTEINDMYYEEALELYDFITRHLKNNEK
jgi:hypothetical protein